MKSIKLVDTVLGQFKEIPQNNHTLNGNITLIMLIVLSDIKQFSKVKIILEKRLLHKYKY